MVALLSTPSKDFTKILVPLSQVIVAILEVSWQIELYGFKPNKREVRDTTKQRTLEDMHNYSTVKGAANLSSESGFKLMLIQAGIFNTIDQLCHQDNPPQVCQLGLNLLQMLTSEYETLQVKLPLSLIIRAEQPLT